MDMFLYIAGSINGPVKIGLSSDPASRIRQLRTSSPDDVRLVSTFRVGEPEQTRAVESAVHLILRDKRKNGEWFDISAATASDAIKRAADFSKLPLVELNAKRERTFEATGNEPDTSKPSRAGRPKSDNTKELVTLRLDPAVIEHYRKSGDGWRTRINEDLLKLVTRASPPSSDS